MHRQTEGNPLFVQEVLRYLVEEGLVKREAGRYVLAEGTQPGTGIPEGLRDVVGRRLSHLGEKTNQVLSIAAVMGREFRLDVLQAVVGRQSVGAQLIAPEGGAVEVAPSGPINRAATVGPGMDEEEIYAALAEARERAIVEERSGPGASVSYRFAHAFFRQALYQEIIAPRRIRLHQQVARAVEAVYGPVRPEGNRRTNPTRLEEHAVELAEHFSHSSSPEDLTKAVSYGELAAQRAMSVFDYGEAERHLRQALQVQEVLDPDDKLKRCDLLLALGEAMLPQGNPDRIASSTAEEAFMLAESGQDNMLAARAAVLACEALTRGASAMGIQSSPEFRSWAERANLRAPPDTRERVYADVYQGLAELGASRPSAAHVYLRRAVELALDLGDNTLVFFAAGWAFGRLQALKDRELVERLSDEIFARPRERVRASDLVTSLFEAGAIQLAGGHRKWSRSPEDSGTHP